MNDYAIALLAIFAVNLLPAFGPPTWSLLVFFVLTLDLQIAPLVTGGAVAAACGRFVLAVGARHGRRFLSGERTRNLDLARDALVKSRGRAWATLGLFALSPLPSAQLFVGAGLVDARLVPLTLAFFAGRLVSYTIYVGGATAAGASLASVLGESFTSPVAIALQVAMLVALVALVRIDWLRVLKARPGSGDAKRPSGVAT